MTTPKACRSTSPDGQPCTKPRGHKKRHCAPGAKAEWIDGGRARRASWYYSGVEDMSEGEWQAYGQYGY